MADKPHPSRQQAPAGDGGEWVGKPNPVASGATPAAADAKNPSSGPAAAKAKRPAKRYALDTDLAAMAAVDAIMAPLSRKDQLSVLEWISGKYSTAPMADPNI